LKLKFNEFKDYKEYKNNYIKGIAIIRKMIIINIVS